STPSFAFSGDTPAVSTGGAPPPDEAQPNGAANSKSKKPALANQHMPCMRSSPCKIAYKQVSADGRESFRADRRTQLMRTHRHTPDDAVGGALHSAELTE